MEIQNSTLADIDTIFKLYKYATDFQKSKKTVVQWPTFERSMVETEILENRQWKLIIDNEVACVWATTFSDPQIWEARNEDPAVYIHRIATNPAFRGKDLVKKIVDWAKKYGFENSKNFIRLDTCGNNQKLIEYYQKCGFNFLGIWQLQNSDALPRHYHNADVCFFERSI